MSMPDERMLHSDAFAWYMEKDPVLRSTVVAVIRLDRSPDWSRVQSRIDRLTRLVPRLRMRVQAPPLRIGPPRWSVDEAFDLDYHLRRVRVTEGGDWSEALHFARRAAMDDFDRSRPLWEFTLLDGLADGGAAFVTKLHHSLTDGIGGVQLASMVIDVGPGEAPLGPLPDEPDGGAIDPLSLTARSLLDDARDAGLVVTNAARLLPHELATAVRNPVGAARDAVAIAASVARFVAPINSQLSKTLGHRHTRRLLATIDVPMPALHDAAALHGCHLNDAFLAALTEGMRRYHLSRGEPLEQMRVTVPVSLRKEHDGVGGNRITLTRIKVPVVADDPAQLMRQIADVVKRWRKEPALDHAQEIAFGLNLLPRPYIGGIFKRVELLASDVPGLAIPVWFGGAKVTGYYGFGPTIGSALNATLMSYADTCNIGVNIDVSAVDDPDLMLACLREGFAAVLALSNEPVERLQVSC